MHKNFLHRLFKNVKIKHHLSILVGISVLCLVSVQVFHFSQFYKIMRSNLEKSTTTILSQLEENLAIHANTIIQNANAIAYNQFVQEYAGSTDYLKRYDYSKYIRNLFNNIVTTNSYIKDIILEDVSGRILNHISDPESDILEQLHRLKDEMDETKRGQGSFHYLSIDQSNYFVYTLPFTLFSNWNAVGYCYIIFSNNSFQKMITDIDLPNNTSIFLIDDNNSIIATNQNIDLTDETGKNIENVIKRQEDTFVSDFLGQQSFIKQHRISSMSCTLISVVPIVEIMRPMNNMLVVGALLGIFLTILLSAISIFIVLNINRGINRLTSSIKDISYNSLGNPIPLTGHNEVDQVSDAINSMLEQLKSLTNKIFTTQSELYELELEKKQAELSALQSQINPHFLYNTLDCIRFIAYSYKAPEIVSISSAMAKIFRYSISRENIVTVRDEIECIDKYIEIIQIRFKNRFIIERNIDEQIMDARIIKFILQPVIENAVYHGLELKSGPGRLVISGELIDEEDIIFSVYDTGAGIKEDKLLEMTQLLENNASPDNQKKTGIGLINIDRRIKNIYGIKYGIKVDSVFSEWTRVEIRLGSKLQESSYTQSISSASP